MSFMAYLNEPCPCGHHSDALPKLSAKSPRQTSPSAYADCCGRFIDQPTPAPDAAHLMRSRYSAFVYERADYLLATWHASTCPAELNFEPAAKWLGLEVRAHHVTGLDTAEVEFVARYRVAGQAVRMHERSRFVCEQGRWFYVDGDVG